jgi:hypothetical protein
MKLTGKRRTSICIGMLLLIAALVYHRWFSFNIFTGGDYPFFLAKSLADSSFHFSWFSVTGLGSVDLLVWRLPIDYFKGLFGLLGFGLNVAEKFLVFWPTIIVANLASFFLIKKITKSSLTGFIGAIVFNYNTYYFTIATAFAIYSAAAWSVLTLYIFIHALERKKLYLFLLSGLALFLTGSYDFRITYVTVFLLTAYFFYYSFYIEKFQRKIFAKSLSQFALQGLLFILLNLYWMLPLLNAHSFTSNVVLQRSLFGNEFYNILYSITFFHPFWTGGATAYFNPQTIFAYVWVIPVFVFLGLYLNRKNKNVLFFGIIALLGIFLTKQIAIPFTGVYAWLFAYVPGFNAFREASKFYFIVAMGYAVLIGAFVEYAIGNFKRIHVYFKYVLFVGIIVLFLWNAKPILTGEIWEIYVPRYIPKEYVSLNGFLTGQSNYARVLWVPFGSLWAVAFNSNPGIDLADILGHDWSTYASNPLTQKESTGQTMALSLKQNLFNNLMDMSAIHYVMIPLEDKANGLDYFIYYGESRRFYVNQLDKIKYLHKINIGTKDITIYENYNYRPHIYTTIARESVYKNLPSLAYKTDFSFVNPTEYKTIVHNVTKPFHLNFSESYNDGWKIRIGNFNWLEALFRKSYFMSDKNHFKNDAGLNSYFLDPEQVCKVESCKVNKDGSYDINLTLYFVPQSYMYLGLIISGSTLVLVLGYLGLVFGRSIYAKRHH